MSSKEMVLTQKYITCHIHWERLVCTPHHNPTQTKHTAQSCAHQWIGQEILTLSRYSHQGKCAYCSALSRMLILERGKNKRVFETSFKAC